MSASSQVLCDKPIRSRGTRSPPERCAQVDVFFFKEHPSHGGKRPVAKNIGSGHGTGFFAALRLQSLHPMTYRGFVNPRPRAREQELISTLADSRLFIEVVNKHPAWFHGSARLLLRNAIRGKLAF